MGLSYYWLIGERKQNKSFIPLEIFEKKQGILVDPETGKLPIYSNAMFAQMAAYEYKRRYGYKLEFFEIPCLGCFLSGLGQSAGKKVRNITYLDSKWKILYHTNKQNEYKIPNHFVIHDEHSNNRFLLCGCTEQGRKPVWLEINNAKSRGILADDMSL